MFCVMVMRASQALIRASQALTIPLNWDAAALQPYGIPAQTKIAAGATSSPDESPLSARFPRDFGSQVRSSKI
jgi:hypothetical protein